MDWPKIAGSFLYCLALTDPIAAQPAGSTGGGSQPGPQCQARGRILDSSGAILPGASLILPDGRVLVAATDGAFCIAGLPPGAHRLEVALEGFATKRIEITVPRDAALDISLTPSLHTNVVVTATRTSRRLDDVPVRT